MSRFHTRAPAAALTLSALRGWPPQSFAEEQRRDPFQPGALQKPWDAIFADVRSAELGGAQDCLAILFQHTVHWRDPGTSRIMQALAQDIGLAGVALPPTLISAMFEVRNQQYQLAEQVWLNPDTAGLGGDRSARRSDSDWTAYNLGLDPERQQYIDSLRQWADGWRGVMEALIGERRPVVTAADRVLP